MYVDGVDFTQTNNQNIAVQLTQGTGMTANGGNGVVIFSRVMTVYCRPTATRPGITVPANNLGLCVVTQRIVIGNSEPTDERFCHPHGGAYGRIRQYFPLRVSAKYRCFRENHGTRGTADCRGRGKPYTRR